MVRCRVIALVSVPAPGAVAPGVALAGARAPAGGERLTASAACGGSAGGLPECSEISQSALGFSKIFAACTG